MRFGKQIRYKISQIIILITICFVSIYECELFESEQLSRRKKIGMFIVMNMCRHISKEVYDMKWHSRKVKITKIFPKIGKHRQFTNCTHSFSKTITED